jgi:hypothetical protein
MTPADDGATAGSAREPTVLSLRELRQVLDQLLAAIETANGGDGIEVTEDLYWVLDPSDTYAVHRTPNTARLSLGQLSDDVAELHGMAEATDQPQIWHDLAHVVGVLQWLAVRDRP